MPSMMMQADIYGSLEGQASGSSLIHVLNPQGQVSIEGLVLKVIVTSLEGLE